MSSSAIQACCTTRGQQTLEHTHHACERALKGGGRGRSPCTEGVWVLCRSFTGLEVFRPVEPRSHRPCCKISSAPMFLTPTTLSLSFTARLADQRSGGAHERQARLGRNGMHIGCIYISVSSEIGSQPIEMVVGIRSRSARIRTLQTALCTPVIA